MRLLLEGPAIEPLLARVRDEHGEDARIIAAEKVRSGGLGGFFTKERFEITIEVAEGAAATTMTTVDVVDVVDVVDAAVPPPVPAQRVAPVGLDALLAAAEEEERAAAPLLAPVPVAVAAAAFAAAGGRTALAEPVARPVEQPVEQLVERPVEQPVEDEPQPWVFPRVEEPAVSVPHRPMSTESSAFADLLADLQREHDVPVPQALETAVPAVPAELREPVVLPEPVSPVPPQAPPAVEGTGRHARRSRHARSLDAATALADLGVPAHLLDGVRTSSVRGDDLGAAAALLVGALAQVPAARPDLSRPGAVVVVVGEAGRARSTALRLAAEHRLTDDAVVDLGAPGVAPTADHVRREVARLRGGDTATVVVIGLDPVADPLEDRWFAAVAATVRADHVVACVDATRKSADVLAWLAGLEDAGLRVDSLDAHHVARTADPASVLGLRVPVLALDGRTADTGSWTALLLERLAGRQVRS